MKRAPECCTHIAGKADGYFCVVIQMLPLDQIFKAAEIVCEKTINSTGLEVFCCDDVWYPRLSCLFVCM